MNLYWITVETWFFLAFSEKCNNQTAESLVQMACKNQVNQVNFLCKIMSIGTSFEMVVGQNPISELIDLGK